MSENEPLGDTLEWGRDGLRLSAVLPAGFSRERPEITDCLFWLFAIEAWTYRDPMPLSGLIRREEIPEPLRPVIADIVSGTRKRKTSKSCIPANERLDIGFTVSRFLDSWDYLKRKYEGAGAKEIAERVRCDPGITPPEPLDISRDLEQKAQRTKERHAKKYGVSVETIENLYRRWREVVATWPNV